MAVKRDVKLRLKRGKIEAGCLCGWRESFNLWSEAQAAKKAHRHK